MTIVRLHSAFLRSAAAFKVPLLSWTQEVSPRFFQAMHDALSESMHMQPSDFVVAGGASLGDCSATLRILGGNSTLALKANGFVADFPSITPGTTQPTNSIIFQGYEAFKTEFHELKIGSIHASAGYHIEVVGNIKTQDVLAADRQTELEKRAQNLHDVIVEPAMRFRLVSKDGKWNCKVTMEKSELVENGVFLLREITVSDLSDCETTQQQFDLVEQIDNKILKLVGLEFEVQENGGN